MSGFYFLFLLWNIWIIFTFIISKQYKYRFQVSLISLLLLILFPYKVHFLNVTIQLPSLVILVICYFYLSAFSYSKKLYMTLSIFIIMTGFTGSLLLELYDPVWIFIDRRLLLGFFVFLLVQFLYTRSIKSQMICTLAGTIQGEIVYSIILKKWGFPYTIGSWDYLDICAIFLLLIMLWALINSVLLNISLKNSVEKEKQG